MLFFRGRYVSFGCEALTSSSCDRNHTWEPAALAKTFEGVLVCSRPCFLSPGQLGPSVHLRLKTVCAPMPVGSLRTRSQSMLPRQVHALLQGVCKHDARPRPQELEVRSALPKIIQTAFSIARGLICLCHAKPRTDDRSALEAAKRRSGAETEGNGVGTCAELARAMRELPSSPLRVSGSSERPRTREDVRPPFPTAPALSTPHWLGLDCAGSQTGRRQRERSAAEVNLIQFYTAGPDEVKSWIIRKGYKATRGLLSRAGRTVRCSPPHAEGRCGRFPMRASTGSGDAWGASWQRVAGITRHLRERSPLPGSGGPSTTLTRRAHETHPHPLREAPQAAGVIHTDFEKGRAAASQPQQQRSK